MPIPKIASSQIELELEEVLCLKKKLKHGVRDQHITNVIQKLSVKITVELEGMEMLILSAVLQNLLASPTTSDDAVMLLADTYQKVQEQLDKHYQKIPDEQ